MLNTVKPVNSGLILSGQVGNPHIANAAVQSGHIQSGTIFALHLRSGTIFAGAGISVTIAPSGITITNLSGAATQLTSGVVGSGILASGSVQGYFGSTRNIASGTVGVDDFGSGAVVAGTIGSGAVQSGNLASGSIGVYALQSGLVTSGLYQSGSIGSGGILGALGGGYRTIASGTVGGLDLASGAVLSGHTGNAAINSGNIASGAVGFPHLANASVQSGTVVSGQLFGMHLASGAVLSGHTGNAAINSGNIASGQIGFPHIANAAVQSGHIASGRIFAFHLQSGTIFAGAGIGVTIAESGITIANLSGSSAGLTSGAVGSGMVASGAVQGFFGTTRNIASGTVGVTDFGSGAVVAGTVGSGAILSGNVASGQLADNHFASGARIDSAEWLVENTFTLNEPVSGGKAVCFNQSGQLITAMAGVSGRAPAVGILPTNEVSGAAVLIYRNGRLFHTNFNFSGWANQVLYLGVSGDVIASGAPTASGDTTQPLGVSISASGMEIQLGDVFVDALIFSGNLASGQVSRFAMASGAINSGHVGSGAIIGAAGGGARNIGSGTIGTNDIGSGAINSGQIASGQIGGGHLANYAVGSGDMASGAVVGSLLSGLTRHIASGTVGPFDLASGTVFAGAGIGVTIAASGIEITNLSGGGGAGLTSGAVGSGFVASGAIQGFFGVTRHIASGTVGVDDFGSGAVIAGTIGSGAIQSGNIASGQVGRFAIGTTLTPIVFHPYGNEPQSSGAALQDSRNARPCLTFPNSGPFGATFSSVLSRTYTGDGLTATVVWCGGSGAILSGHLIWAGKWERMASGGTSVDINSFAAENTVSGILPNISGAVAYTPIAFTNAQIDGLLAGEYFRFRLESFRLSGQSISGSVQVFGVEIKEP